MSGALRGLVDWSEQTTPPRGHKPILAATKPNSKAASNGGRLLLGSHFMLRAVPDAGESRVGRARMGGGSCAGHADRVAHPPSRVTFLPPLPPCHPLADWPPGTAEL